MTQLLCLIVSADADASLAWRRGLEPWGFRPYAVPDPQAALAMLGQCRFDAVLLDGDDAGRDPVAADPAGGGRRPLDALPALGERTAAPILVVWSEADDLGQIEALARGAADTVVRSASARLVGAKLKRLVEIARDGGRSDAGADGLPRDADGSPPAGEVAFGPLRLDAGRALATCAGRPLALTAGEFALVAMLAARSGEVVTRETIVRTLDAEAPGPGRAARRDTHRSADMHVCRIRRKLEAAGATLEGLRLATVHGRGYALRRDPLALP